VAFITILIDNTNRTITDLNIEVSLACTPIGGEDNHTNKGLRNQTK